MSLTFGEDGALVASNESEPSTWEISGASTAVIHCFAQAHALVRLPMHADEHLALCLNTHTHAHTRACCMCHAYAGARAHLLALSPRARIARVLDLERGQRLHRICRAASRLPEALMASWRENPVIRWSRASQHCGFSVRVYLLRCLALLPPLFLRVCVVVSHTAGEFAQV